MGLNIEAELVSGKFAKPIDLRLTEGSNVEVDESARRTYFRGVEVTLYPEYINGKLDMKMKQKVGYHLDLTFQWTSLLMFTYLTTCCIGNLFYLVEQRYR